MTITDPGEMGEFGAVAMDGRGNTIFSIPADARRTVRARLTRRARTRLAVVRVLAAKARARTRQPSGRTTTIVRPLVLRAERRVAAPRLAGTR